MGEHEPGDVPTTTTPTWTYQMVAAGTVYVSFSEVQGPSARGRFQRDVGEVELETHRLGEEVGRRGWSSELHIANVPLLSAAPLSSFKPSRGPAVDEDLGESS